jgi:hypothetical protein
MLNFSTSLSYILIQIIPPSINVNLAANIGYFFTQGMVSVVYLAVNRNIRKTILNKLGLWRGQISHLSTSGQSRLFKSPARNNCPGGHRNRIQTF